MGQYDDDLAEMQARRKAVQLRESGRFAQRVEALRRAESFVGPKTIGPLAMVDIGWCVWARTDGPVDHIRLNAQGDARGGIVVEIASAVDRDTGEIARAFRCLDPFYLHHLRWTTLTENQVNPDGLETPERNRTWRAIRALCLEAARPGQNLDLLRTHDQRMAALRDAWTLARSTA